MKTTNNNNIISNIQETATSQELKRGEESH